jgi:hypothetical protein
MKIHKLETTVCFENPELDLFFEVAGDYVESYRESYGEWIAGHLETFSVTMYGTDMTKHLPELVLRELEIALLKDNNEITGV